MNRGIEVAIHLTPGPTDTDRIAMCLGNVAAYRLGLQRGERLDWQVLRVQESGGKHFYRLLVRHPERVLDLGIRTDLARILDEVSANTPTELEESLQKARSEGARVIPLRTVQYEVDYWRDDFWNWIG
jgi:hypothetical protein